MVPEGLSLLLRDQIPCREIQLEQCLALLDPDSPAIPAIVAYGSPATGKNLVVASVLEAVEVPHVIVRSRECITGRHLLERTILCVKAAIRATGHTVPESIDGRCENLSALAVQLQRLLAPIEKFVLVFSGVDRQREAPSTLLQALARLGEIIPTLSVVFIVTHPRPRFLSLPGLPYIHFPPYSRQESLDILSLNPLPILGDDVLEDADEERRLQCAEDDAWLWPRFCGAVYDSLGKATTREVTGLRSLCESIWPKFVSHIRDGSYGTRDFSRLMVRTRPLFQSEEYLRATLTSTPAAAASTTNNNNATDTPKPLIKRSQALALGTLSYYSKFLLVAAYLASCNPSRTDQTFFSKSSEASKKRRRKKGSAPANPSSAPNTPSSARKRKESAAAGGQQRRFARKLLGPQPFLLERWLAIFHAIVPHPVPSGSADLLTQVATLQGLRMVVRVGSGAPADALDPAARWRANVGWEYVKGLSRGLRIEVEDFVAE